MPNVTMTLEEYEALRRLISSERESEGASLSQRKRSVKKTTTKKRKATKYQVEFGKQMKKLKAKHKRTPVTKLMKKAHAATKKVMK